MLRILLTTLVVLCCCCCSCIAQTANFGSCRVPNSSESAVCVHVADCPHIHSLLTSGTISDSDRKFLRDSQCGTDGTQTDPARKVMVCCSSRVNKVDATQTVKTTPAPPKAGNILPDPGECGRDFSNKILGGNVTQIDEFPWMAMIEYKKPGNIRNHHCGGSLINSRYVITAAHCVKGVSIPKTWELSAVRLGEWDTTTNPDCELDVLGKQDCAPAHLDVNVELAIAHELYVPESLEQFYDIALLRLAESVVYTDFIMPICMPVTSTLRNSNFKDYAMDVAGWGATEVNRFSTVKLKIIVNVWSLSDCLATYRAFNYTLNDSQICAGGAEKIDTCQGDSGGPLMLPERMGTRSVYFLVGVVSYGPSPCGLRGWPGVYTRVGNYIDWVNNKLEA